MDILQGRHGFTCSARTAIRRWPEEIRRLFSPRDVRPPCRNWANDSPDDNYKVPGGRVVDGRKGMRHACCGMLASVHRVGQLPLSWEWQLPNTRAPQKPARPRPRTQTSDHGRHR
jgi:hypothetical protein